MAEDKKSFIMYADQLPIFEALKDAEAGKLIKHILRYVNDENPVTDSRVVAIAFEPIKQQLKRDLKSYEKTKTRNKESGEMGNLKRWHPDLYQQVIDKKLKLEEAVNIAVDRKTSPPDPPRSPLIAKIADNGNDTDNGNDKERESTAPSPENVKTDPDEKTDPVPGIVPWPTAEKPTYQKTPAFAQTSAAADSRPVQREYFDQAVSWHEALCMKHKCKLDELPALFDEFFLHLKTQQKQNLPAKEASAYFDSWMGRNYKKKSAGQGVSPASNYKKYGNA